MIFLPIPAYLFIPHAASLDRSLDTSAQDWWNALLAANPPKGAMLISNDRDEMMPLWYMQQVEGQRTDLAGVFPLLLAGDGPAPLRSRALLQNAAPLLAALTTTLDSSRVLAERRPLHCTCIAIRLLTAMNSRIRATSS